MFYIEYYEKKIVEKKTSYGQFYFLVTLMMTSFVNEAGWSASNQSNLFLKFYRMFSLDIN